MGGLYGVFLIRRSYDDSLLKSLSYRFVGKSPGQTNVKLIKRFDNWVSSWYGSPNNRMPWLGSRKGILTTSGTSDWWWYGTIVSDNLEYQPAPWLNGGMRNPGLIWYFVNEDDCDADRRQSELIFTVFKALLPS